MAACAAFLSPLQGSSKCCSGPALSVWAAGTLMDVGCSALSWTLALTCGCLLLFFEGVLFLLSQLSLTVCYMPYAKCSRAGGWACDWALKVVSAWIKDCRRLLQTFFFSPFKIFFYCPFSDRMKTWHFLQLSSKLWRTWKLGWIPGNTQLETPSCIIPQVRHWLQTVLTAFLHVTEQLLKVTLCFFFCKGVFKKCFFPFFSWPLIPKLDHVLFAVEKLISFTAVLVFSSQSSFLACLL